MAKKITAPKLSTIRKQLTEARLISEEGLLAEFVAWLPNYPWDGPPLPRGLRIKWPWKR